MCFTRKPPGIEAGLVGLLFVVVINVVGGVVDDIDDVVDGVVDDIDDVVGVGGSGSVSVRVQCVAV